MFYNKRQGVIQVVALMMLILNIEFVSALSPEFYIGPPSPSFDYDELASLTDSSATDNRVRKHDEKFPDAATAIAILSKDAQVQTLAGNFSAALVSGNKALAICDSTHNTHARGEVLMVIANTYFESHNYKNAIHALYQSIAIKQHEKDFNGLGYGYTRLGYYYVRAVKDRLLAVISHDFKSPLNTITALLSLIEMGAIADAELKEMRKKIKAQLLSTSSFVETTLHWISNQLIGKSEKKLFPIGETVEEMIALFQLQADLKNITLIAEAVPGLNANADQDLVRLILRNLISNAIKFSNAGSNVNVSTQMSDGAIIVAVHDTGVGISPETLKRIFASNGQTSLGTSHEKGSGLGLMLCQYFAEKNGGKLWAESTAGQGSSFYFSIPN